MNDGLVQSSLNYTYYLLVLFYKSYLLWLIEKKFIKLTSDDPASR